MAKTATKKPTKPTTSTTARPKAFGEYSAAATLRWMGANLKEVTVPQARAALAAAGITHMKDTSIRGWVAAGRNGKRGEPANLKRAEQSTLRAAVKATVAAEKAAAPAKRAPAKKAPAKKARKRAAKKS